MSESATELSPEYSAPLSLKSIVAVLFRRKALVLGLFIGIFGLVALITAFMPRQYESRMKVLVKNGRADLVVSPDARNGGQPRGDVNETEVNSEIELLTSNDLLAKVVRSCHLFAQTGTVPAAGIPSPQAFEKAVRKLERDLKITPVRKANIIQITYAAANPELAASVLKELSTAYLDAHLSIHRSAGSTEFFQNQAAQYETQLRAAENHLSQFRRDNDITSIVEQKDLTLRKAMESDTTLREADAALAETTSRVRELRKQVGAQERRIVTQSRVLPNQYSVERLNTMLAELENRRIQALMKFRADDRVVTSLDREIANTRAALDRADKLVSVEQSTDVNPLRSALEGDLAHAELQEVGLKARRNSLARILGANRARLAQLENATIEHETLQRSVKESEENYMLYARKQEEARIADSLDQQKIANVAIAEFPVAQHLPAKPNVALNLALGFFLAGFVSLGAAFAFEYSDSAFHTPAELETATGIPVLATVAFQHI
jgi:uncharacterized protein involved in exopolysaccharide biosynthesis